MTQAQPADLASVTDLDRDSGDRSQERDLTIVRVELQRRIIFTNYIDAMTLNELIDVAERLQSVRLFRVT